MTSDKTLHLLTHSKITTIKQKYHIFMENNYSFLNKNNLGEKSGILHFFFFFLQNSSIFGLLEGNWILLFLSAFNLLWYHTASRKPHSTPLRKWE